VIVLEMMEVGEVVNVEPPEIVGRPGLRRQPERKARISWACCCPWWRMSGATRFLWKERNARTFGETPRSPTLILQAILDEADFGIAAGFRRLSALVCRRSHS